MTDAVRYWHEEHRRFARLLDFLDAEMTAFHDGGHPDYGLMQDVVHYLQHYADRYHHPREDIAFARLLERAPALAPVLRRLMQEHRVLKTTGEALYALLDAILQDSVITRDTVEAVAATYLLYYRQHIDNEETEVLPAAAHALTTADWAEVDRAVEPGADPLFGADVGARYRVLRAQIEAAQRTGRPDAAQPVAVPGPSSREDRRTTPGQAASRN